MARPTVLFFLKIMLCLLLLSGTSFAAEAVDAPETELELDTLIIEGTAPPTADASTELSGNDLRMKAASTLGKTLERELGVSNLSYGPGVGQPVIRGMSGPRVRVMHDGIGAHDASSMSPDHAVAVESMLADSITVHKGPATLRFGSGAIGGMVDVKHKRIPNSLPEKPIEGTTEFRYDHNPQEKAGVIGIDAGKDLVAVHFDYFQRGNENTQIPGQALDEDAIREQFHIEPPRNSQGELENTSGDSQGGSAGISLVGDPGYIGVSYYEMVKNYGVPPGVPGHSHSNGSNPSQTSNVESVRVAMEQRRYDFEAMLYDPLPLIESAAAKVGYVDYRHDELDNGQPFTQFNNEVWESRFELGHRIGETSSGFVGLQWQDRNFSATGVETYVPPSHVDSLGVFLTEKLELTDDFSLELGARQEHQVTTPKVAAVKIAGVPSPLPLPQELTHSPYSLAANLNYEAFKGGSIYLAWQHAQRAPDIQELLASGPHLATRSFEFGRPDLNSERADHHEIGLRFDDELTSLQVNTYHKQVKDFIYQQNLGYFFNLATDPSRFQLDCASLQNCLPVYGYQGNDANFLGYEAELNVHPTFAWADPHLTLFSDYVRGRFDDDALGDVPRLPPLRFGAEIGAERNGWQSALRYTRALAQDKPGLNETQTAAYDRLDLDLSYDWKTKTGQKILVFGKASNMSDSVIRNSTSFLRSFAPEPGMSLEIGFRANF